MLQHTSHASTSPHPLSKKAAPASLADAASPPPRLGIAGFSFAIRWYALSYIVGFVLFIWLGRRRIAAGNTVFTKEMLDDFLTWGVIGVILGGRLGYVLFYKFSDYLAHPLDILKVWEGGMSFHGGFLGVLVAMWLFGRKHHIGFWKVADFVAPLVPLGLASGLAVGAVAGASAMAGFAATFSATFSSALSSAGSMKAGRKLRVMNSGRWSPMPMTAPLS